jgi:NADPH oxidase 5
VTQLVIKRPKDFKYNPGDYAYLRVPRLGVLSWHPFTLSSCPEQTGIEILNASCTDVHYPPIVSTDTLWFHIRASGNWTRELREHFHRHATNSLEIRAGQEKTRPSTITGQVDHQDDLDMQPIVPTLQHIPNLNVRVLLDGPYCASTTALFNAEHAVLIGAGIGVTPFASVLGSILAQFREMQMMDCPNCNHTFHSVMQKNQQISINKRPLKLKKLDFIWVSREQKSIQWFMDLLEGWEKQQQSLPSNALFMDCQIYITSIPDVSGISCSTVFDLPKFQTQEFCFLSATREHQ